MNHGSTDTSPAPYSFRQYLGDLARYISPYRQQFFIGVFFRLTSDIARLYPAWAIAQIITLLSSPHTPTTTQALLTTFIIWGVISTYYGWAHNTSKLFGYQVAEKASLDIYKDCLAHVFTLDLTWQEAENSGNKMKRIDKGQDGINLTIRRLFDVVIEVAVNMIGIVVIFSTLSKTLSLALILFMITYFLIGTALLKRAIRQEKIVNKKYEDLGGLTFESLNNIQTIKALSIDKGIMYAIKTQITSIVEEVSKRIWFYQSQGMLLFSFEVLFEFGIISVLAWGVWHSQYELSLLVLFIGLFAKVGESTRELTSVTQDLALAKTWVSRAMHIMRTQPVIEHPERLAHQKPYDKNWKELRLNHVQFAYKKGQTLKDITLTISRGEKVGIVGLSGAGKSTLFKLLLDLYENYEGKISLDGLAFKHMQRQSYIDHVAVVLQDTELFDMTLKENIEIAAVHGLPANPELLQQVVHMAHLDDVVARMPLGLETVVGEKGVKLSGGQRQRLGIARALYRQPDILLMDEATSHLDAHSEKEIQKALEETMNNFTTIVIAHRLSTIRAMDKIIVLGHGVVEEQGTFNELLMNERAFSRMWREQKL